MRAEALSQSFVESEFAEEISGGILEYKSVDYLTNTVISDTYGVGSLSMVIALYKGGVSVSSSKIDSRVFRDQDEFKKQMKDIISKYLDEIRK